MPWQTLEMDREMQEENIHIVKFYQIKYLMNENVMS